jgi:hypothetical protein
VDIRNIWEKDNHAGFNLELKETYVNIWKKLKISLYPLNFTKFNGNSWKHV